MLATFNSTLGYSTDIDPLCSSAVAFVRKGYMVIFAGLISQPMDGKLQQLYLLMPNVSCLPSAS